ncbi:hypothetical protein C7445_1211, partial [Alicyclobacillus sacchari]
LNLTFYQRGRRWLIFYTSNVPSLFTQHTGLNFECAVEVQTLSNEVTMQPVNQHILLNGLVHGQITC